MNNAKKKCYFQKYEKLMSVLSCTDVRGIQALLTLSSLTSVNFAILFFRFVLVELVFDRILHLQSPAPPFLQGIVRPPLFGRLCLCLSTPIELFPTEED